MSRTPPRRDQDPDHERDPGERAEGQHGEPDLAVLRDPPEQQDGRPAERRRQDAADEPADEREERGDQGHRLRRDRAGLRTRWPGAASPPPTAPVGPAGFASPRSPRRRGVEQLDRLDDVLRRLAQRLAIRLAARWSSAAVMFSGLPWSSCGWPQPQFMHIGGPPLGAREPACARPRYEPARLDRPATAPATCDRLAAPAARVRALPVRSASTSSSSRRSGEPSMARRPPGRRGAAASARVGTPGWT